MLKTNKRIILILFTVLIAITLILSTVFLLCGLRTGEHIRSVIAIIMQLIPIFIACGALWISSESLKSSQKIADKQNELMIQEWLPYLSYEKLHVGEIEGVMGLCLEFFLGLKNDGKCIVQYEIKKFDVQLIIKYLDWTHPTGKGTPFKNITLDPKSVHRVSQPEGVIGIKSSVAQYCGAFQFLLDGDEAKDLKKSEDFIASLPVTISGENKAYQLKVDFIVEYSKRGEDQKKYFLKYVLTVAYSDGKFVESISTADIEGY